MYQLNILQHQTTWLILLLSLFSLSSLLALANPDKKIKAVRLNEEIKLDGRLTEKIWKNADKASDFIQSEPRPGTPATFQTQVFFLYDNTAIYIGAALSDPEPDKILSELSLRDQIGNADNFRIFLDTYKSGLNGFKFYVTSSGVQFEAVVTNNTDDTNWNAVWESAVSRDEKGWYVEIRIPYSSLRFPPSDIQDWNVQFGREIRRFRELSYWSPIDPTIAGWVQQSGQVTDISNIKSPVRLSLTPYLSTYLNTGYDPSLPKNKLSSGTAYAAGLDLKYGLNDAFTLDMTLIPDFGQVISDKQVLNLSPFEVFFDENRQFFTEGTELFNRGRLFYSRRIGGRPLHFSEVNKQLKFGESIISNPETSQLFNATKISGRTSGGTGLGAFNAFVGEEFATLRDENGHERQIKTNPLTNYNVLVIDRNLKNNSYVSLMNTNVYRLGEDYDANVTGSFFNIKTKNQKYYVGGFAVLSQKYFTENTQNGHAYSISLGKISGNWTYEAGQGVKSDKYDPNDMGFLQAPNEQFYYGQGKYTQYKPKNDRVQQFSFTGSSTYTRLYKPDVFTDFVISLDNFILWKSRFALGFNAKLQPTETFDYFEPRSSDFSRFVSRPANFNWGALVSSDYRKPFAYDIRINYRHFYGDERKNIVLLLGPRFRFSDQLSIFANTTITYIYHEPGYVNKELTDLPIIGLGTDGILFGNRNRLIVDNSITGRYIFNSLMGINLRIRHYWDRVRYLDFGNLSENGQLDYLPFNGKDASGTPVYDRNVNIFNIDLQYNWRFAPGSDLIFVWKNQINKADAYFDRNYLNNLGGLFDAFQTNNFSVRFLYFLDYLYLFPKNHA